MLFIGKNGHGTKVDQPMYQHLSNCSVFNDHIMLFILPAAATNTVIVSKELCIFLMPLLRMLKC